MIIPWWQNELKLVGQEKDKVFYFYHSYFYVLGTQMNPVPPFGSRLVPQASLPPFAYIPNLDQYQRSEMGRTYSLPASGNKHTDKWWNKLLSHNHRLLDSLMVECWLLVQGVPGSIPTQGPCHTKDVIKIVPVVPLFSTEHWKGKYLLFLKN